MRLHLIPIRLFQIILLPLAGLLLYDGLGSQPEKIVAGAVLLSGVLISGAILASNKPAN